MLEIPSAGPFAASEWGALTSAPTLPPLPEPDRVRPRPRNKRAAQLHLELTPAKHHRVTAIDTPSTPVMYTLKKDVLGRAFGFVKNIKPARAHGRVSITDSGLNVSAINSTGSAFFSANLGVDIFTVYPRAEPEVSFVPMCISVALCDLVLVGELIRSSRTHRVVLYANHDTRNIVVICLDCDGRKVSESPLAHSSDELDSHILSGVADHKYPIDLLVPATYVIDAFGNRRAKFDLSVDRDQPALRISYSVSGGACLIPICDEAFELAKEDPEVYDFRGVIGSTIRANRDPFLQNLLWPTLHFHTYQPAHQDVHLSSTIRGYCVSIYRGIVRGLRVTFQFAK